MKRAALIFLVAAHAAVLLAPWIAPYEPALQNRGRPYQPPSTLRLLPRPAVIEEGRAYPVRFFHQGRLFGVDEPARIFLLGSDGFGRDQFSRLLHGGRISLGAGLLATAITLLLGSLAGALAGYYGRWTDDLLMRLAELFLALPWLYLLLGVRAFLPLSLEPAQAFLLIVAVIGTLGWARPARLVRGVVLSARERGYVLAARGFGASDFHLLRRHILPETAGVVLTQATLLAPRYVLAEVTLSFLGLGVGEPAPSWGNMLAGAQQYAVLVSYWWMLLPGVALVPVFTGYFVLANSLLDGE
ncbi:MAG: ABC transporter permease [Bryobacteraceae bacterium]